MQDSIEIMTIGIVLAGTMGLVLFGFRSIDRMFLGIFLIYYLCALMVVGFSGRFLIQALPPLAIFSGFMLQKLLIYYSTHKNNKRNTHTQNVPSKQGYIG